MMMMIFVWSPNLYFLFSPPANFRPLFQLVRLPTLPTPTKRFTISVKVYQVPVKLNLKKEKCRFFLYLFISQMFGREADEGSIYYCIEEGLLRQQTFFAPRSVVQQTKAISLSYYCYYHYYCLCQQSQASGPQRGERSQLYI